MERFEYTFNNGLQFKVVLGEDGYNVNLAGGNLETPLMGTFTSFEELLYGVAPIIQNNVEDRFEFADFTQKLSLGLSNTMVIDEIEEILLK